jgi:undecaprenyl-diphosphatase
VSTAPGGAASGGLSGPGDVSRRQADRLLVAFLAVATPLRLVYLALGPLDLSPDEAHYWEWSRRLDWAYYSKGPLVAYLIRLLTEVGGSSVFAIRFGAVILSVVGAVWMYRLAREAFGDPRVGLLAVVGLQLTPLVWAGSLLMTIDPPFLVAWTLLLLCLRRGLAGRPAGWWGAGVAVGLGIAAKYTMLFVLPAVALYVWRAPEARRWVRRPPPYLATGMAFVLVLPILLWNARRGWVSARHVASQGRGAEWAVTTLAEFVLSQLGVLTPLIGAILAWALWFGVREGLVRGREPYRFLTAFAAPILAFYLLLSLQGKVQANWPAAAYPPLALVAAGAFLERRRALAPASRRAQSRLLVAAGGLALAVTLVGHAAELLPIPPGRDPTTRLRGWRELGEAVSAIRREMPDPERTFVASDRYQITSELAFYVAGHPPAYNVNLGRRLNQYDLWEGPNARLGWDGVYVHEGTGPLDGRVGAAFDRIEGPSVVDVRRGGRVVRQFSVYRGYGFLGIAGPTGPITY